MANPSPQPQSQPKPAYDAAHVPMTEEFDSARWTLPPIIPVLIALAVVAVVIAAFVYGTRYKKLTGGEIQQVYAVELPGQGSVLAAVQINVKNIGTDKPLWIHGISADLTTADGKQYHDTAASAVDFNRYFQAFPDLKAHATAALEADSKIPIGAQQQGTAIFGFPVDKAAFDARKSLDVTIEIYDEKPLKLTAK